MTSSLQRRLERLEREARFDAWLWFERFLESLTEPQLEDLATHWRWPEPMPPPLPIGASKLDSKDRKTLQKMFEQDEREFGPCVRTEPYNPNLSDLAGLCEIVCRSGVRLWIDTTPTS